MFPKTNCIAACLYRVSCAFTHVNVNVSGADARRQLKFAFPLAWCPSIHVVLRREICFCLWEDFIVFLQEWEFGFDGMLYEIIW